MRIVIGIAFFRFSRCFKIVSRVIFRSSHHPILNDPPLPWFELASSVPCHFVMKSIVKASLPEIGFVTGQPQVDVKGVVILAALVTSIVHYFSVLNRQAFTKTSKSCTFKVCHADMTLALS